MSGQSNQSGVGYGNPPKSTQFRKGQSGNPKGRPRGRNKGIPFDTVLGQIVTVRENGIERKISAAEAFISKLTRQGLDGDSAVARDILRAIEDARKGGIAFEPDDRVNCIVLMLKDLGANDALQSLRMARILNPSHPSAQMKLEPWIVERALHRLDKPLTVKQQRIVMDATRTPNKVKWPTWWSVQSE